MSEPSPWFVTGAAGFIGSNLCTLLLQEGGSVVGYDNFLTGRRENIDRLSALGGGRFRMIEGDIRDRPALDRAMSGCSRVAHLAAQVSVQRSMDDPLETNAINVDGFLNVLLAAADKGVHTLAYASSCAVYGDSEDLPLGEGSVPRPLSPYAASKLINEHYAGALAPRRPDMGIVGLRFFNIFGPWQDHRGGYAAVIPKWIDACLEGVRPILFGDGSATRDFCYVGNVARLVADLGAAGRATPGHRVFNVASGRPVTLADLFEVLKRALTARGIALGFDRPDQRPWRTGDILHSSARIDRSVRDLAYRPAVDLEAGVDLILDQQYGLIGRE